MRRQLKKEARNLSADISSARFVTRTSIPIGGGKRIEAGVDVTEQARGWPNLRTLLLRGALVAVPDLNVRAVVPMKAEEAPAAEKHEEPKAPSNPLESVSILSSKREIRDALIAAGQEVAFTMSKTELLLLRDALLADSSS